MKLAGGLYDRMVVRFLLFCAFFVFVSFFSLLDFSDFLPSQDNPYLMHQAMALLHNLRVKGHVDCGDERDGWTIMAVYGEFFGGDLLLRQFGIRLAYMPGDMIALRSALVLHEIADFDGALTLLPLLSLSSSLTSFFAGWRHALVLFNKQKFRDLSRSDIDWLNLKQYETPEFGPRRETMREREERLERKAAGQKEAVVDEFTVLSV